MEPVSGMNISTLSSLSTVNGMREPPKVQCAEDDAQGSLKFARDEYIPTGSQEPTGRYWLDRDEEGRPKVRFDDPEQKDDSKTVQCSTDEVDREIKALKQRRDKLKRQINHEADDARRSRLEAELAQVENELCQKDNDTYRRQHAKFF